MSQKIEYYDESAPLQEMEVEDGLRKKLLEIKACNTDSDQIYAAEVKEREDGLELIMGDGTEFLITCKKVK